MRMLSFVLIASAIALGGCTQTKTVGCSVEQAVESGIASAIGASLSCSNLPAIVGDIQTVIGKANLCAAAAPAPASEQAKDIAKPKGVLGNVVCPLATDAVLGLAVSKIPPAWGCTGGASADQLKALIVAACEKAVPL